jgi:hypothetical protein
VAHEDDNQAARDVVLLGTVVGLSKAVSRTYIFSLALAADPSNREDIVRRRDEASAAIDEMFEAVNKLFDVLAKKPP